MIVDANPKGSTPTSSALSRSSEPERITFSVCRMRAVAPRMKW